MIDIFTLLLLQWFNVCVGVVISIISTLSTFFSLCKAFLRNEILNCFQSANDCNNSKAFLLFFSTPSLLFRMTVASTMVLFISQSFFSLSFHLQSTEWRTFTLSLLLYVDFIIIQSLETKRK